MSDLIHVGRCCYTITNSIRAQLHKSAYLQSERVKDEKCCYIYLYMTDRCKIEESSRYRHYNTWSALNPLPPKPTTLAILRLPLQIAQSHLPLPLIDSKHLPQSINLRSFILHSFSRCARVIASNFERFLP